MVKEYPGEVTILAIGPCTNVAIACMTGVMQVFGHPKSPYE